ncbi:DNA mismatch repair endonuclease MutL [Chloroflexota bacterium]
MENSLDAGARQVSVEVGGGGIGLIRVSDNGEGIPSAAVELAFHRHATSKIARLADLEKIATLGFRGEALASIAAVAEVEIITRVEEEESGFRLRLKDGVVERGPVGRSQGTTVAVRQLFRGFPARLKFLKSEAAERSRIAHVVSQYALSFPEVKFSLVAEGRRILSTAGHGSLRDVLVEIYGSTTVREMREIKVEKEAPAIPLPQVTGLVGSPSAARSNRSYLSFFVNRRWVQSHLLTRAVEEAYKGYLQVGRYPLAVINLSLPPTEMDVNVHPAKTEIRFRNDHLVFSVVSRAVRQTLLSGPAPEIAAARLTSAPAASPEQAFWSEGELTRDSFVSPPTPAEVLKTLPILRVLGQVAGTYIITEGPEGLYLIDQHAAHERILYEKVLAQHSRRQVEKQGLLEPITLELSPQEEETLRAEGEGLVEFGFDIEPFGGRGYILRAVPALMQKADLSTAVGELLASLDEGGGGAPVKERLAISVACHGAVRAGQTLGMSEMQELVGQLEQTTMPRTCPHGRPTTVHLSSSRLEREFGRG